MKKALISVVMLFVIVASAMAEVYPIPYKDRYCKEEKEWKCDTLHFGRVTQEYCRWEKQWVCKTKQRETSVDVPKTDLTPVEDRLYSLENNGGFGYSKFIKAMHGTVLDWLKGIFVQIENYNQDKITQQELDREQNKRIFACEQALGMTEGY